jgi:hypothetical protein
MAGGLQDVEILQSLSGLMEIENLQNYGEEAFMSYKEQSKGLLQMLLVKLESNHEKLESTGKALAAQQAENRQVCDD